MKQRKTIAALSLLLAGCICLSAWRRRHGRALLQGSEAGGSTLFLHKARIHPLWTELSDEQQEALTTGSGMSGRLHLGKLVSHCV